MPRLYCKPVSGLGILGYWICQLGDHYERETGMHLYPGTLNLELPEPDSLPPNSLRWEAHEYGGRVSVNIVPCLILGRPAFLLRTDQNEIGTGHHPRNLIEIATDLGLRDAYSLRDGDTIEVEIP